MVLSMDEATGQHGDDVCVLFLAVVPHGLVGICQYQSSDWLRRLAVFAPVERLAGRIVFEMICTIMH